MEIKEFKGDHAWLSNFYACPIEFEGFFYPSVENAYQAAKTMVLAEREPFEGVTPAKAKRMGRRLTLRRGWETIKLDVMLGLLRTKFRLPVLQALLISTGNTHLEEGNWWGDTFWGVCTGVGENHLGKLLMQVREEAKRGEL